MATTLEAAQIEREHNALLVGRERASIRDARAAINGLATRAEKLTMPVMVALVAGFLQAQLDHYDTGKVGKRPAWYSVLKRVDLPTVASAALQCVWNAAYSRATLTYTLLQLGGILDAIQANAPLKRGRSGLRAKKSDIGESAWDDSTRVLMGAPLWNAASVTCLFRLTETEGKLKKYRAGFSKEANELLDDVEGSNLMFSPPFRPMLVRPLPWKNRRSGAYLTSQMQQFLPLVRKQCPESRTAINKAIRAGTMKPVLRAVNSLQSVRLSVNPDALALRKHVWDVGIHIPDVTPLRTPLHIDARVPGCISLWTKRDRARYMQRRHKALSINGGIPAGIAQWERDTYEADLLLTFGMPFYQPHMLDFRGRVYPAPAFSHHRGDATKALIQFYDAKPLGEHGLFWLKVHVANTGDFEKVSKEPFGVRVRWVDDNLHLIRGMVAAPSATRMWQEADAPFSFYAACCDLIRALDAPDPAKYESRIPVALDGSNSGVQHYSAAMRAPEGVHVCLVDPDRPHDLYAEVAKECQSICEADAKGLHAADPSAYLDQISHQIDTINEAARTRAGDGKIVMTDAEKAELDRLSAEKMKAAAAQWMGVGITRSIVKRPVMTFGYSAVAYGFSQQIRDDYMSGLSLRVMAGEDDQHAFGADEGAAASTYLGKAIYQATKAVLPNVSAAMSWLQHASSVLAGESKGVEMVTPTGFPMIQRTTEEVATPVRAMLAPAGIKWDGWMGRSEMVGSTFLAQLQLLTYAPDPKRVNKSAQKSAISPNVIHACDAAHLTMTVNAMADAGHLDMLVIHDSFASHAGNANDLSHITREQMVALYENWSPLADIYERAMAVLSDEGKAKLQPPPPQGDLDLRVLLKAKYAFA